MRRLIGLWALAALTLAACASQPIPDRASLPKVVPVDRPPCAILLGDGLGARVTSVIAGSPAVGVLTDGDVVTAVDGQAIASTDELIESMAGYRAGDVVDAEYTRDGVRQHSTIKLKFDETLNRAILGVDTRTAYQETAPESLPADGGLAGDFVRYVTIGEELYEFDPVGLEWARLDLQAPVSGFTAVGDSLVALVSEGSDSKLTVLGAGDIPLRLQDWIPVSLGEQVGRWVTLFGARPSLTAPQEAAVIAVDPASGELVWTFAVTSQPVALLGSPDGAQLAYIGGGALAVIDRFGRPVALPEAADLSLAAVFGWFDAERLLVADANGFGALAVSDGTIEPILLDLGANATDLLPVGDGRHLLVATQGSVERIDTAATGEARRVVQSCFAEIGPSRQGVGPQ